MDDCSRAEALAAIVDRLAAEFPDRPRAELERVAAESWALFSGSHDDETLRVIATDWYARMQLAPELARRSEGDSPAA
jgi:hypothetical protein